MALLVASRACSSGEDHAAAEHEAHQDELGPQRDGHEQENGTREIQLTSAQGGKRQIVAHPDRDALARYGISINDVLGTLEAGVGGSTAELVFDDIRPFDIFLRLQEESWRPTSSPIVCWACTAGGDVRWAHSAKSRNVATENPGVAQWR